MTNENEPGEKRREPWRELGITGGVVAAVAVAVLVLVAVVESWSPGAWAALAAWTTAGVAVAAGAVAMGQLGEARRLRLEQAQPYVVAFMADASRPKYVDLVIRNFGLTAAADVRVEIDPVPQRSVFAGESWETVSWPARIPVLVPGQEWRTLWDHIPSRDEADLPVRHDAVVRLTDSQRRQAFCFEYVLDWGVFRDRMRVTERKQ